MAIVRRAKNLRMHFVFGLVAFVLIWTMSSLSVQGASSIAQGFESDDPGTVPGALVSLKSGTANTVELSTVANTDRLLGVVGENSLIELSDGKSKLQVVTTGEAAVLVSDINGAVKTGDKITTSPVAGVGMKALTSTLVIGTAQANLASVEANTREITDKDGKKKSIKIGAIPLQVDKVFYEASQDQNSYVPPVLQDFANNLLGRPVSPIRVLLAAFLIAFVFVTVVVLVYSSIRSSIISIGRNPLSESAVRKSLLQVGLTVFGVLAFTVIVVYLILAS
jgi:hypothetical protein